MRTSKNTHSLPRMVRRLKKLDLVLMRSVRALECPGMTGLMRLATRVGDPVGWTLISLGIMLAEGNATGFGLKIGVVSLVGGLAAKAAKHLFRRQRPCLHQSFPKALAASPTGGPFHRVTPPALARLQRSVWRWAAPWRASHRTRPCISLSRVYLGVHFPSDVVAGMCLGALVGLVCCRSR